MEKFDPQYKKRNFPQVRPEWLALRQEAVLQPNQRIVDAHHHFWDEGAAPYHADDLLADIGNGHAVAATILIEGKARYRQTGPEHLRSVGETDAWRPYVEARIESFTPARCMFESNFPVDKGMCSYAMLWNAFKRLAAGYSPGERDALFFGTATRVYQLDPKETTRRAILSQGPRVGLIGG